MTNRELKEYLNQEYPMIVEPIKRFNYSCVVKIKCENGEIETHTISLPRVKVS